ncbi:hypothetical protein [Streptomyces sp. NPDC051921]|uniref:hypothetical protein n=1 Tax=Streptomyces sp. NPDC051921 TaxID=3155806 RepID=UPI00341E346E
MAVDGGRIAARGFQYQYLRTVEALLAGAGRSEVAACRVEGPGAAVSLQHVDSVDFDLADVDGRSLMAVQVKSAGAGRVMPAREAVSVLVRLVTGFDALEYRLITSAAPDESCVQLAELLARHGGDVPALQAGMRTLLKRAPAVWSVCEALSPEQWERLGRSGVEFDARSDLQLREDLHNALRAERESAGLGLGHRAGGLVLGFLVAEVMRRAADPALALWTVEDFRRLLLVGDEELMSAVGRQEFGIVYGQMPPLPEVDRAGLVERVSDVLEGGEDDAAGVRTCVVTGLSGLGKSSLAAAYVADRAFRYDSVFWVEADSEEALVASFVRVLAHLTGSRPQAEVSDPRLLRERVHAQLQSLPGAWLMVFDDASPVVARAWLPRRGRGRVIVTSLGGHWHAAGGRIELGPMGSDEAMRLLRLRLELGEDEADRHAATLSRLARTLEFWPLAIEVACGYLVTCGIGVERLAAYADTLISRAADDDQAVPSGYPRTLAAAVAVSAERLVDGARARGLLPVTLATVAALCRLAPRRAPVHLALASAFVSPQDLPPVSGWVVFDEAQVPVREVLRELLNVSLVRLDEPLPVREESFPGSEDTVSMNAVLQQLLAHQLGLTHHSASAGLSELACHTDRWLRGALVTGQAERSWELAQHATVLVGHIRSAQVADEHTALLMGNLAAFHHAHGQYDAARGLLELELEWLSRAGEPDAGVTAQAHAMLAHLAHLCQDPDADEQIGSHLRAVLAFLRQLQGPVPEPVAGLASAASGILRMRLHTGESELLAQLQREFAALGDGQSATAEALEVEELLQIQDLLSRGEAEQAEQALVPALSRIRDPWSPATADLKRLLVEAHAMQGNWEQANTALTEFLPYAGPHTLYGFALHHLVHNVGCEAAWQWVLAGEQRAVELLGRLFEETSVRDNPAFETATDEGRFILLQVVHDIWKAVRQNAYDAMPLELMRRLTDKVFTDPHDPGSVWERIYAGLLPRLAAVLRETVHERVQLEGDAVLAGGLPLLHANPTAKDEYDNARCHAVLALSSDPVYGVLAGRSSLDVLLPEARQFLPSARPLVILQPEKMLRVTSPDTGKSIDMQIHRACHKGLRRMTGPEPVVGSPEQLTLVLTGRELTLRHDDGTVIARATTRTSSQWRQAARARSSAMVFYGYAFDLHHSPTHRSLMASPHQLQQSFTYSSDNGLLAAAVVPVRLEPEPAVKSTVPPPARKQPRKTSRARRSHRRQ